LSSPRSSITKSRTLCDAISQPVKLGDEVGRGGEGSVFEVDANPSLVVKVYHKTPLPDDLVAKLRAMSALWTPDLEKIAAWPRTILFDPVQHKPVGLLKDVLDRGVIRQVNQATTNTPNDTAYFFSPISDAYFDAMLDELRAHYKVDLKIENIMLRPGPAPTTSLVVDGTADIVSQLNATGGDTQGLRRRTSRRFTCTLSAISQYLHIPAKSALAKEINTVDDLHRRKGLRICAGPLATQTAKAFFPQHTVSTKYLNDLTGCARDVEQGKADLIVNPLPSLQIAGIRGYKSVHTLIVAGTPLWVAREGIECPPDDDPRTEDRCFVRE